MCAALYECRQMGMPPARLCPNPGRSQVADISSAVAVHVPAGACAWRPYWRCAAWIADHKLSSGQTQHMFSH